MAPHPDVRATASAASPAPSRSVLPLFLPLALHLVLTGAVIHLVAYAPQSLTPSQVLWLRHAAWALTLSAGVAWLARGLAMGALLWAWALLLVIWALAASGVAVLWHDVVLVGAIGPAAHFALRRRQQQRLFLEEEVEALHEEIGVRRAEAARIEQAVAGSRKRLERYGALQTAAQRLNTFLTVEELVRWMAEQVLLLIGKSEICLVFLVDQRSQTLALRVSHQGPARVPVRSKHGDAIDQAVLRSRHPILVDDIQKDFRFPQPERERPFRAVIAAPLAAGGKLLGVVRLDSAKPSSYTQDDLRLLDVLLELCAAALANVQLIEETQRLAATDGLTGLSLRRVFVERWERELATVGRSGGSVGLLLMDIDHFKAYNDALGHAAGDLVLQGVAALLQQHSPPEAVIARYGGEEFIVMLPGADRTQAVAVAERLCQTVAGQPFVLRRAPTHVTVSIGVAACPADGADPTALLQLADRRLYRAKTEGRNRTCST